MRLRIFTTVFALFCLLISGVGVVQAGVSGTGSFVLFLGDAQVGREEYTFSDQEFQTEGRISLGGQTLMIKSSLIGRDGVWDKYEGALSPGASFSAVFGADSVEVEVGPMHKSFPLQRPFVVLDNNVFAHYEQVLGLLADGQDQITLDVVVPSLVLSNQNPVLQGEVKRIGPAQYRAVKGEVLGLEEYVVTMPGNLQIRVLGREHELIGYEIPMQAVKVTRQEYVGLQLAQQLDKGVQDYTEEDFSRQNGDITLAGTLTLPPGEGPFPAILLNSGSGPQDRHGNTPPSYMTNMFSIMAQELAKVGIASLRYDERGVGESTGDYNAATLEDLLSDVDALIGLLQEHPQIDRDRIAMLGHSEGAYFAPLFQERLQAMVLLAGSSISLDQLMIEQLEYQMQQPWLSAPEREMLQAYQPLVEAVVAEAKGEQETSEVLPMNLKWLRQHMDLRPLDNIVKVQSPVLIVHGERDLKVMPYHAEELEAALGKAGNDKVQVHYLKDTTHEFLFFPFDNDDFDPLDPMRINPALFELIVTWLDENL